MVTMMKKLRKNHKGVSLVEIIVAMLVLSISVVSLVAMFMRSLSTNMKSRRAMSATVVAQNVMEAAKEYARNNTVVGEGTGGWLAGMLPSYTYDEASGYYFATEGYYTYAVSVHYSDDKYASLNNTTIPDITALGQSETVQICPDQVKNGGFEQAARDYFDMCLENAYLYLHKDDEDDSAIENKSLYLDDIARNIKSNVELEVTGNASGTYNIKAKLVYKCEYKRGGEDIPWLEDFTILPYEAYEYRNWDFSTGVDEKGIAKKLKVFLFLDPCSIYEGAGFYTIGDQVDALAVNCDYELYIANQVSEDCFKVDGDIDYREFDLSKLNGPSVSGSTGNIEFFSTNALNGVGSKKDADDNFVIYSDGSITPLQNVKVDVMYYEDGGYVVVSSLESAVSQ